MLRFFFRFWAVCINRLSFFWANQTYYTPHYTPLPAHCTLQFFKISKYPHVELTPKISTLRFGLVWYLSTELVRHQSIEPVQY